VAAAPTPTPAPTPAPAPISTPTPTPTFTPPPGPNGLIGLLTVPQQLEMIYAAYFNRAADGAGFNFWQGQNTKALAAGQSTVLPGHISEQTGRPSWSMMMGTRWRPPIAVTICSTSDAT
jgi:hypothetical protein